jgi:chromate transporter
VPFLRQGVVVDNHWLTEHQFLDAVAVGLITPGPVVITAAFIGYVVAGLPGAIVSAVAIFTPICLGVVIPGRWFIRHRQDRWVRAFVRGATAAAAGAIAGATLILARGVIIDIPTALIAVASLAYLWRLKFRLKEPALVIATAGIGRSSTASESALVYGQPLCRRNGACASTPAEDCRTPQLTLWCPAAYPTNLGAASL